MKTQCPHFSMAALALSMPGLFAAAALQAQPFFPAPLVTIFASQPLAYEPGNHAGVFTISRGDYTNAAVTISYTLTGTATNGVDYATVPTSVTLAAGQSETNLLITPVPEPGATEYKKVALHLPQSRRFFYEPWGGYDTAVVYIAYNYTNEPPTIAIESPTNASTFPSRPNIVILAKAGDSNG